MRPCGATLAFSTSKTGLRATLRKHLPVAHELPRMMPFFIFEEAVTAHSEVVTVIMRSLRAMLTLPKEIEAGA